MSGNCATGNPTIATSPSRTVRMEMTMATTGRLMKKLAMSLLLPRGRSGCGARGGRFRRVHSGPRLDARESLHDHTVARLQSGADDPETANSLPSGDLSDL